MPNSLSLEQNYPNPFKQKTKITYTISGTEHAVSLRIFNIMGKEIKTLINNIQPAGTYTIEWDGTDATGRKVPGGIYFYQLITETCFSESRKMLLIN